MSIVIGILTFILLILAVAMTLVVLMQKTKDGGMGSALGGGLSEQTFGADTGNVLTRLTIKLAITFFVLTFGLYLGHIYVRKASAPVQAVLPTMTTPEAPAGEAPAPAPTDTPTPEAAAPATQQP